MREIRPLLTWIYTSIALLGAFHLVGCGSGSTQQKPSKTITEITISPADTVLSVSSTLQLQATGRFSDGSTSDVSSAVFWSSSDTSALSVNGTGLVTAVSVGRIPRGIGTRRDWDQFRRGFGGRGDRRKTHAG